MLTELGQKLAAIIVNNPSTWVVAFVVFWAFIVRPLLQPSDADPDNHEAHAAGGTDAANDEAAADQAMTADAYDRLIERTFDAWHSGAMDDFSDINRKAAGSKEKLLENFQPVTDLIRWVFATEELSDNEYLVSAHDNPSATNYVLTNEHLYYFHESDPDLILKVAIPTIESVEANNKWLSNNLSLELAGGESIRIDGLGDGYPEWYLTHCLESRKNAASSGVS